MSETKRTQINIRLSDTELEKVKLSAEVLGLSVGKYAKQVLLKSKLVKPQLPAQSQQAMIRQLAGMANNLNQLTKLAHESKAIDSHAIDSLRQEVNALWQQLGK
ncbi:MULTISPECIES: plasmid mobilization protein [Levilactobacillus]|jgi:hypothetical protein|uniref:Mobilization protein MobC n=1 Tax=Levilactobacillus brevis TaxID=1580 RepID=A0A5B7Y352_LEVBR|nr:MULTISPECIES: plasmid mobilization relaxosome protein MobC [Levilactobacillus]MCT3569247.1 plasmid mobilization relaxosome protein MobC [Levilactobacillus brevis]MCT3577765.1 plasmid mobilization relaxosome protein MobC [Levilactobacillus brevis]MCX7511764.1 plasmid mobilization relaxosome protein MobC [Levilactobacillus brevis]QCZ54587.1 Mobilization protein MobC [Levilactobacillus brevis]